MVTLLAMHFQPGFSEFRALAAQGNVVPVYADLMADFETPVSAYAKLRKTGPAFLFESIADGEHLNRYSFIGAMPRKIISAGWETTTIRERGGSERSLKTPADPLAVIEQEMADYRPVTLPGMPPFVGGAAGYLSYEYIHAIEPTVPLAREDALGMPVCHFMIMDRLVIFDRAHQTIRLLANAILNDGDDLEAAYEAACAHLRQLCAILSEPSSLAPAPLLRRPVPEVPRGNFERSAFEDVVDASKEYIRAGDIIQVVLSQRFERRFERSPLDLYRALRTVNPSPYSFIFEAGDFSIVGASPEKHVSLEGDKAVLRPIAGTIHRGKTPEEDLRNEQTLLADEKERAEHLMLVDLARNDLGRVCRYGSVSVHPDNYFTVERYSHVMHIVSETEGRIQAGKNAYDLMRATFPAGTVSGAPKVRAMQIIAEKERDQRGPYAGALGYFSFDGNLDSCIMLRTAVIKDGTIHIQSGAGIVADSVPENEYQETLNKARGMLTAVALAEEIEPLV